METAIDFKSLRAKFQEELQSKERPTVPHKPRRFPLPAGGATSPFINLTSSRPDGNAAGHLSVSRDDNKVTLAKRPISVPPCFFHHANDGASGVRRLSSKERQLLMVPPAPTLAPSLVPQVPKQEPIRSSAQLVTSPIKCKKKAMPTPFKPTKFSRCIKDILEGSGEHPGPNHGPHLSGATPAGPSVTNGFNHHNGGSTCGSQCPSPEQPVTPPPTTEPSSTVSSVTQVLSTLEKAKKRFSPKNLLVYARPKSFYTSKCAPESSPPSADYENVHDEARSLESGCPPVTLPTDTTSSSLNGFPHNASAMPDTPPARKPLPDLASLGPLPKKPLRPPQVDLSSYTRTLEQENGTEISSRNLANVNAPLLADIVNPEDGAVPLPPEFEAPEFPDFEASVLEALNGNLINLRALELEVTEFGAPPLDSLLLPPNPEEASDVYVPNPQRCGEVLQKYVLFPTEAAGVPLERPAVPELWTESWSATAPQPDVPRPVTSETSMNQAHNVQTDSNSSELPSEPSFSQQGDLYEVCDNVYEEVETVTKFHFGQTSRKRKGPPKNPYADSLSDVSSFPCLPQTLVQLHRTSVTAEPNGVNSSHLDRKDRSSPEHYEEKELRKREKQRLEREKKEQREREKKENEMKKKFKITGQEEPMYHARVLMASKLRKHDLQVKSGDTVSIIRTTNCPKGKWLARDAQNRYGYISVMNVELNMKEMLELGKRASQAAGRGAGEADTLSVSSRSSHHNPVLTSSFSDDSEEWSGDTETSSALTENQGPNRAVSMPDMFGGNTRTHQAVSAGSMEDLPSQLQHEALQKLAVFFQNSREDLHAVPAHTDSIPASFDDPGLLPAVQEPPYAEEDQFSFDVELLPPPELYADFI